MRCEVVSNGVACGKVAVSRVSGHVEATHDEPGDHWERHFCREHSERARIFAAALDVDWERIIRSRP